MKKFFSKNLVFLLTCVFFVGVLLTGVFLANTAFANNTKSDDEIKVRTEVDNSNIADSSHSSDDAEFIDGGLMLRYTLETAPKRRSLRWRGFDRL